MALSLFWDIWLTTLWICACLSIFSLQKDWNSCYVNFHSFQKRESVFIFARAFFCRKIAFVFRSIFKLWKYEGFVAWNKDCIVSIRGSCTAEGRLLMTSWIQSVVSSTNVHTEVALDVTVLSPGSTSAHNSSTITRSKQRLNFYCKSKNIFAEKHFELLIFAPQSPENECHKLASKCHKL